VAILSFLAAFFVKSLAENDESSIFGLSIQLDRITFFIAAITAVISIFLYKKRINQFIVNRLNIILNLFLLGFFVYRSLSLSGESLLSQKGIWIVFPLISIVLLILANKAIKRDEDLVKSVDRLR
jgi:asparagine N-glycosylation enzyme membrane subunit Stt3